MAGNIAGRIALTLQYDGTAFSGYQIQNRDRTVQGELERALEILFREKIRVTASGRTDTGVHALGQVVHFDVKSKLPLERIAIGLNGILPKDVSVVNVCNVKDDFHARFSVISRHYLFKLYNFPFRSPFMMYRALWVPEKIDSHFIREVLAHLEGEHDFRSFCKAISADNGTVRRILATSVEEEEDTLAVRIKGTAFLHNMIRIIIGTILEMNRKGQKPDIIMDILQRRNRDSAGPTAPPYGLYLEKVEYPEHLVVDCVKGIPLFTP